jgi:L-ascorbate metabolism protein UlaG (beta-lactamase superfamily)
MGGAIETEEHGERRTNPAGSVMDLIPALRKDGDLVREMDSFLDRPGFYLWWLGQSGFLLQWNGRRVLIDPYLSDSLTKKYAQTDKPHVRMSERVIDPNLLKGIDIVTSSHNHTDHLDAETIIPIFRNNPKAAFIIPEANRDFVCTRTGVPKDFPIGLTDGGATRIGDFTFYGVPAKHNEIERDENGNCRFMGYVITFGTYHVYHSGDTLWFDELPDLLRPWSVDVAMLPINGNDPARKVAGNLDCKEAVALGKAIGARCVIPCHYDMFTFNTADVNDFIREAEQQGQHYRVLRHGEMFHAA